MDIGHLNQSFEDNAWYCNDLYSIKPHHERQQSPGSRFRYAYDNWLNLSKLTDQYL
jgi:hypothetical protein